MRRWRNPLLLFLLLVCAASWWWARHGPEPATVRAPAPTAVVQRAPGAATPAIPPPAGPVANIHLAVFNGTGEPGLARRASRHLADLGCVVVEVADAPHDTFATTLLVNRRLAPDRAGQLAARLGGIRVLREWDGRAAEDAVLILGHDHARRGLAPR